MSSYSPIGGYSVTRTELKYENVHKAQTAQKFDSKTEPQQKYLLGTISNETFSRAKPQKPRQWKSMLIHQGWCTALYTQHLLDSQSFEFEICILQALNMPLIRCTNVFSKGGYPVTLLPTPRRLAPSLGLGTSLGKATTVWQLSISHCCHQM